MQWIQVTVETTQDGIDPVCAALDSLGIDQVSIVDSAEEIARDLQTAGQYWDYVDYGEMAASMGGPAVRTYLDDSDTGRVLLERVRSAIGNLRTMDLPMDLGSLQVTGEVVDDENWIGLWKQYFTPIPVGERLLVQPAWEEIPARYAGRLPIRLQNSAIFGTGQHASTQLCLELLERRVRPGDRILDLGCGSGVLFIGAMLLGAGSAVAVDVDPKARDIVPEHAELNGLADDLYRVVVGDAVNDPGVAEDIGGVLFDIVAANIVADVILALTPAVPRWIRPGGLYLVSGIIGEREQEILEVLAKTGFQVDAAARREDWVAIAARYLPDTRVP